MGSRAGLDQVRKISPPPGFDPRTVQPVASRYTDYATRPTFQEWYPNNARNYGLPDMISFCGLSPIVVIIQLVLTLTACVCVCYRACVPPGGFQNIYFFQFMDWAKRSVRLRITGPCLRKLGRELPDRKCCTVLWSNN